MSTEQVDEKEVAGQKNNNNKKKNHCSGWALFESHVLKKQGGENQNLRDVSEALSEVL